MAHLTHDEVVRIVGDVPDERIVQLIETGANASELTEAVMHLTAEDDRLGALARPESGIIAQLIDILEADEPYPEKERV
jgi:hypothetical protein